MKLPITITEGIETLGTRFRGLWRSVIIDKDTNVLIQTWSCTFEHRGQMIDTDYCGSPLFALRRAVSFINKG